MTESAMSHSPSNEPDLRQIREDLAAAFRLAVRFGLHEGICNHFTARVGPDRFLLNPGELHWSEITASSLLEVQGGNAGAEAGDDADLVAYRIHWPIYRQRHDVNCVLHTHMPYATALTMVRHGRLEMGEQTALRFNGRVAYDEVFPGPVGTQGESEGERLARVMGGNDILLAKNHGIVVAGRSIGQAFDDLYFFERCCMKQWLARGYGLPLDPIAPEVADATRQWFGRDYDKYKEQHFVALKRLLGRDEGDYRS